MRQRCEREAGRHWGRSGNSALIAPRGRPGSLIRPKWSTAALQTKCHLVPVGDASPALMRLLSTLHIYNNTVNKKGLTMVAVTPGNGSSKRLADSVAANSLKMSFILWSALKWHSTINVCHLQSKQMRCGNRDGGETLMSASATVTKSSSLLLRQMVISHVIITADSCILTSLSHCEIYTALW